METSGANGFFKCEECGIMVHQIFRKGDGDKFVCSACTIPNGDAVKEPSHYTYGLVECRHAIETVAGKQWYLGTAMKYIWRATRKGNERQDIEKAIQNLRFYLEQK